MPTITGKSNTGLFGAMLTVGRSCSGCMVSSRLGRPARAGPGVASAEFNTSAATLAKRLLAGSQPAIGAKRCQPGIRPRIYAGEERTEIATPVRIRPRRYSKGRHDDCNRATSVAGGRPHPGALLGLFGSRRLRGRAGAHLSRADL